ncbi:MAG TPA: tryptophan synthase subunit alpha [Clostridium sp.]|jgi:tryptophan synthase alpha chain|nr:tryptophan synthase subunit alpha [Clostridium sp.]
MSRIKEAFENKKAFIPFITAGDPNLKTTEELVIKMADAGADLIELGIPFSDPVAEGPVIEEANYRALKVGTTTDKIFDMVLNIRKTCSVPLAFMTYANPVFTYGTDKFMRKCKEADVSAVIIPDIPFEEKEEITPFSSKYGIDFISMIAPTSKSRVRTISREAQGFLYCVSSMGVTGVRKDIGSEVEEMIKVAKEANDIPCAIGFGISTPEQAEKMSKISDGVIIGSAIVEIIGKYGENCISHVLDYVHTIKKAIG